MGRVSEFWQVPRREPMIGSRRMSRSHKQGYNRGSPYNELAFLGWPVQVAHPQSVPYALVLFTSSCVASRHLCKSRRKTIRNQTRKQSPQKKLLTLLCPANIETQTFLTLDYNDKSILMPEFLKVPQFLCSHVYRPGAHIRNWPATHQLAILVTL